MSKYDFTPFLFIKDIKNAIKSIFVPHNIQVGTSESPRELNLTGRLTLTPQNYTFSVFNSGTLNLTNNDSVINLLFEDAFLSSSIEAVVNLPQFARNGQLIFIKDLNGHALHKNVTFTYANNIIHQFVINQQSAILNWNVDVNNWVVLQNYIPQQSWKTILEEDFSILETQTFPTNSIYTINGKSWTKGGSTFETGSYTKIENNIGLQFYCNNLYSISSATIENCYPYLAIKLSDLYEDLTMSTPIKVSMLFPTSSGVGADSNQLLISCGIISSLLLTSSTTRTSDFIFTKYQSGSKVSYSDYGTVTTSNTALSFFARNSDLTDALILSSTIGQLTYPSGFIPGNMIFEFYTPMSGTYWTKKSNNDDVFLLSMGLQHNSTSTAIFPHPVFTNPQNLYLVLFGAGNTTWTKPPAITKIKVEVFY